MTPTPNSVVTDEMVERATDALIQCLFGPHDLPVDDAMRKKLEDIVRYAMTAALESISIPVGSERTPITMQDVRLIAGEGKLPAWAVLDAVNIILKSRQHATPETTQ